MKGKKLFRVISNSITVILLLNLIVMTFLVVSSRASGGEPQAFGYQLKTVLSGSMEPTFYTGSVIAVKPLDSNEKMNLQKGDIITFQESENLLITHRITKVIEAGDQVQYETKGDNNKTTDNKFVLSDNVVAQYTGFTIPYVGYFVEFAKSKGGSAILLIGPGILLILYASYTIFQTIRKIEPKSNYNS